MSNNRHVSTGRALLVIAVCLSMALSGCAGWGQDGPADTENDTNESNASDDLNETQNDSNTSESDSGTDTSSGTDESGDSSDQESTASSDDESSSEASEGSGSEDSNPQGETPENGAADGGDSSTESDSKTDSDSDQKDSKNTDDSTSPDEKKSDGSDEPTTSPPDDGDNESPPDEGNETPPKNGDNETDPDPDPEGNTVTVDVRHLDTDEPVDIPVRLNGIDTDYEETVTATDGTATFENVPNGDYEVKVAADGWWAEYAAANEVTVSGDTSYTLGVRDAPDTHTLTVTVEDAETGEPIEGAEVSGVGGRHPDGADLLVGGETNADGVLTVDAYESGYLISVSADGYEIPPNQEVNLTEDKSVSFELTPAGPTPLPPANETGNETAAAA